MQNTKESQIQHGGRGLGIQYIVVCREQACSQHHTRTQNSQRYRLQKSIIPQSLLTKIKYQVPNKPRVRRRLENQGQSHGKSQVKTGREQTEVGETQEGDSQGRRKQPETARKETARDRGSRRQAAWKFQEAVFPIQRHGFEGQVT